MRIGDLRYRVRIQERTLVDDGAGVPLESWSDLATVWANVQAPSGTEGPAGTETTSEVRYIVTIRDRSDVKPEMRVVWNGQPMRIVALLPAGPGRLKLECRLSAASPEVPEGS